MTTPPPNEVQLVRSCVNEIALLAMKAEKGHDVSQEIERALREVLTQSGAICQKARRGYLERLVEQFSVRALSVRHQIWGYAAYDHALRLLDAELQARVASIDSGRHWRPNGAIVCSPS